MTYRKYIVILLCVYLPVGMGISYLAYTLERFSGDLTRIGGFREKDFGWNGKLERFEQPLFTQANSLSDYDQKYDVVVFGDSFSDNSDYGWQNFFVNETGLSLITFHHDSVDKHDLFSHDIFMSHPPRVFIYEIVEHGIHTKLKELRSFKKAPRQLIKSFRQSLSLKPIGIEALPILREKIYSYRIDEPVFFLKRNVKNIFGRRKAFRHSLSRDDLFSNNKSGDILIYYGDLWKRKVDEKKWEDIEDGFAALQSQIELTGDTVFMVMVATDKSTAYSEYIINESSPSYKSIFTRLSGNKGVRFAPVEEFIKEQIKSGIQDVYLPNDTHWGSEGHKAAASAMIDMLYFQPD